MYYCLFTEGSNAMKKKLRIMLEDFLLEELDYIAKARGLNRSQLLAHMICDEWNDFTGTEEYYRIKALEPWEAVSYM